MTCLLYGSMFGALRSLFRRPTPKAPVRVTQRPCTSPANSAAATDYAAEPSPPPTRVQSSAPPDGPSIKVSYEGIIKFLPRELHGKITPPSGAKFYLPLERVLETLNTGSVKVALAELRRAGPTGLFVNSSAHDNRLVDLPMGEILPQLGADTFARRQQRLPNLPTDIDDLFGPRGERLTPLRVLGKNEISKLPPAPTKPRVEPSPSAPIPVRDLKPLPPGESEAEISDQKKTIPFPGNRLAVGPETAPPSAKSSPAARPARATGLKTGGSSSTKKSEKPLPNTQIARAKIAASKLKGATTDLGAAGVLRIPLSKLAPEWPDEIREEIETLGLESSECHLPAAEMAVALRQGKIECSWGDVLAWLYPNPGLTEPSSNSEVVVVLPLEVIAPLYLTQPGALQSQKKAFVNKGIPDLFSKVESGSSVTAASEPANSEAVSQAASTTAEASVPEGDPAPAVKSGVLTVSLSILCGSWPEVLRRNIASHNLSQAKLELPLEVLEEGLKGGRLEFGWEQLCSWLNPPAPEDLAETRVETNLELPLKILVPLYLQHKPKADQKPAESPDIPDIFSSSGEALMPSEPAAAAEELEIAPPETGIAGASEPQPRGEEPARHAVVEAKEPKDLPELFGMPEKRNWTPNEIVHHTSQLPGVSGAMIALQDGLLVASCMPPEWKTETIAAFIPQIFGRMNQYAKELKMGDLTSVSFIVDQGTLQIHNAGIIYFAALGKPKCPLPYSGLNLIARELSRHTR